MPFRLLHYSDPHFGAYDPEIARAAISAAHKLKPDLTVVSGDLSMRGRRFEFDLAKNWIEELPSPLVTFPGNHDVPGLNQIIDRFIFPFRRFREQISEIEEPSVKLGEIGSMCTANSSTPFGLHLDWSRGFLSPVQLHAMKEFFSEVPQGQLRVLGMHHPIVGSGTRARALVSPMPLVRSALDTARVDLVLAGHLHQSRICLFPEAPDRPDTRSLVVSQAPSVCSTRLKGEPNGFHLLTLSPQEIEIELWRWGSDRFLPERSRSFFAAPSGWESE